jgi:hypothetical protein
MESVFGENCDFGLCETGAIGTAKDFAPFARSAKKMRPATPVLTANVDLDLLMNHATMDGKGNFGLGAIQAGDCVVLTMRLQVGTLQIYWLADASDSEVWKTIDAWKKGREAGFALMQGKKAAFFPWEIAGPQSQNSIEQFRSECGKDKAWEFTQTVLKLVDSGVVHYRATTDIPGVPLEHVLVNILMTDRLAETTEKETHKLLAKIPAFSRPSDATVH